MEFWKLVKYLAILIAAVSAATAVLCDNVFVFVAGILSSVMLSIYSKTLAKKYGVIMEDEMTARISSSAAMWAYVVSVMAFGWCGALLTILENTLGSWAGIAGPTLAISALILAAIYTVTYFALMRRATSDEE